MDVSGISTPAYGSLGLEVSAECVETKPCSVGEGPLFPSSTTLPLYGDTPSDISPNESPFYLYSPIHLQHVLRGLHDTLSKGDGETSLLRHVANLSSILSFIKSTTRKQEVYLLNTVMYVTHHCFSGKMLFPHPNERQVVERSQSLLVEFCLSSLERHASEDVQEKAVSLLCSLLAGPSGYKDFVSSSKRTDGEKQKCLGSFHSSQTVLIPLSLMPSFQSIVWRDVSEAIVHSERVLAETRMSGLGIQLATSSTPFGASVSGTGGSSNAASSLNRVGSLLLAAGVIDGSGQGEAHDDGDDSTDTDDNDFGFSKGDKGDRGDKGGVESASGQYGHRLHTSSTRSRYGNPASPPSSTINTRAGLSSRGAATSSSSLPKTGLRRDSSDTTKQVPRERVFHYFQHDLNGLCRILNVCIARMCSCRERVCDIKSVQLVRDTFPTEYELLRCVEFLSVRSCAKQAELLPFAATLVNGILDILRTVEEIYGEESNSFSWQSGIELSRSTAKIVRSILRIVRLHCTGADVYMYHNFQGLVTRKLFSQFLRRDTDSLRIMAHHSFLVPHELVNLSFFSKYGYRPRALLQSRNTRSSAASSSSSSLHQTDTSGRRVGTRSSTGAKRTVGSDSSTNKAASSSSMDDTNVHNASTSTLNSTGSQGDGSARTASVQTRRTTRHTRASEHHLMEVEDGQPERSGSAEASMETSHEKEKKLEDREGDEEEVDAQANRSNPSESIASRDDWMGLRECVVIGTALYFDLLPICFKALQQLLNRCDSSWSSYPTPTSRATTPLFRFPSNMHSLFTSPIDISASFRIDDHEYDCSRLLSPFDIVKLALDVDSHVLSSGRFDGHRLADTSLSNSPWRGSGSSARSGLAGSTSPPRQSTRSQSTFSSSPSHRRHDLSTSEPTNQASSSSLSSPLFDKLFTCVCLFANKASNNLVTASSSEGHQIGSSSPRDGETMETEGSYLFDTVQLPELTTLVSRILKHLDSWSSMCGETGSTFVGTNLSSTHLDILLGLSLVEVHSVRPESYTSERWEAYPSLYAPRLSTLLSPVYRKTMFGLLSYTPTRPTLSSHLLNEVLLSNSKWMFQLPVEALLVLSDVLLHGLENVDADPSSLTPSASLLSVERNKLISGITSALFTSFSDLLAGNMSRLDRVISRDRRWNGRLIFRHFAFALFVFHASEANERRSFLHMLMDLFMSVTDRKAHSFGLDDVNLAYQGVLLLLLYCMKHFSRAPSGFMPAYCRLMTVEVGPDGEITSGGSSSSSSSGEWSIDRNGQECRQGTSPLLSPFESKGGSPILEDLEEARVALWDYETFQAEIAQLMGRNGPMGMDLSSLPEPESDDQTSELFHRSSEWVLWFHNPVHRMALDRHSRREACKAAVGSHSVHSYSSFVSRLNSVLHAVSKSLLLVSQAVSVPTSRLTNLPLSKDTTTSTNDNKDSTLELSRVIFYSQTFNIISGMLCFLPSSAAPTPIPQTTGTANAAASIPSAVPAPPSVSASPVRETKTKRKAGSTGKRSMDLIDSMDSFDHGSSRSKRKGRVGKQTSPSMTLQQQQQQENTAGTPRQKRERINIDFSSSICVHQVRRTISELFDPYHGRIPHVVSSAGVQGSGNGNGNGSGGNGGGDIGPGASHRRRVSTNNMDPVSSSFLPDSMVATEEELSSKLSTLVDLLDDAVSYMQDELERERDALDHKEELGKTERREAATQSGVMAQSWWIDSTIDMLLLVISHSLVGLARSQRAAKQANSGSPKLSGGDSSQASTLGPRAKKKSASSQKRKSSRNQSPIDTQASHKSPSDFSSDVTGALQTRFLAVLLRCVSQCYMRYRVQVLNKIDSQQGSAPDSPDSVPDLPRSLGRLVRAVVEYGSESNKLPATLLANVGVAPPVCSWKLECNPDTSTDPASSLCNSQTELDSVEQMLNYSVSPHMPSYSLLYALHRIVTKPGAPSDVKGSEKSRKPSGVRYSGSGEIKEGESQENPSGLTPEGHPSTTGRPLSPIDELSDLGSPSIFGLDMPSHHPYYLGGHMLDSLFPEHMASGDGGISDDLELMFGRPEAVDRRSPTFRQGSQAPSNPQPPARHRAPILNHKMLNVALCIRSTQHSLTTVLRTLGSARDFFPENPSLPEDLFAASFAALLPLCQTDSPLWVSSFGKSSLETDHEGSAPTIGSSSNGGSGGQAETKKIPRSYFSLVKPSSSTSSSTQEVVSEQKKSSTSSSSSKNNVRDDSQQDKKTVLLSTEQTMPVLQFLPVSVSPVRVLIELASGLFELSSPSKDSSQLQSQALSSLNSRVLNFVDSERVRRLQKLAILSSDVICKRSDTFRRSAPLPRLSMPRSVRYGTSQFQGVNMSSFSVPSASSPSSSSSSDVVIATHVLSASLRELHSCFSNCDSVSTPSYNAFFGFDEETASTSLMSDSSSSLGTPLSASRVNPDRILFPADYSPSPPPSVMFKSLIQRIFQLLLKASKNHEIVSESSVLHDIFNLLYSLLSHGDDVGSRAKTEVNVGNSAKSKHHAMLVSCVYEQIASFSSNEMESLVEVMHFSPRQGLSAPDQHCAASMSNVVGGDDSGRSKSTAKQDSHDNTPKGTLIWRQIVFDDGSAYHVAHRDNIVRHQRTVLNTLYPILFSRFQPLVWDHELSPVLHSKKLILLFSLLVPVSFRASQLEELLSTLLSAVESSENGDSDEVLPTVSLCCLVDLLNDLLSHANVDLVPLPTMVATSKGTTPVSKDDCGSGSKSGESNEKQSKQSESTTSGGRKRSRSSSSRRKQSKGKEVAKEESKDGLPKNGDLTDTGMCTFLTTGETFKTQHTYRCYTCDLINDRGCCAVCVERCHKGHDITYWGYQKFFCDCGYGSLPFKSCQGLLPPGSSQNDKSSSKSQMPTSSSSSMDIEGANPQTLSEEPESKHGGDTVNEAEVDALQLSEAEMAARSSGRLTIALGGGRLTVSLDKKLIARMFKAAQSIAKVCSDMRSSSDINQPKSTGMDGKLAKNNASMSLRGSLSPSPDAKSAESTAGGGKTHFVAAPHGYPQKAELAHHPINLMKVHVAARYPSNSFSTLRMADLFSPATHLPLALKTITRSFKPRPHGVALLGPHLFAVAEGYHMNVYRNGPEAFLPQNSSSSSSSFSSSNGGSDRKSINKSALVRVFKAVVPFHIWGVKANPSHPCHVAVYGLQECHVLVYSDGGRRVNRVIVDLSLELFQNSIQPPSPLIVTRVDWLPHSQVHLVVTTNRFVKVYNLSKDVSFPVMSVTIPMPVSGQGSSSPRGMLRRSGSPSPQAAASATSSSSSSAGPSSSSPPVSMTSASPSSATFPAAGASLQTGPASSSGAAELEKNDCSGDIRDVSFAIRSSDKQVVMFVLSTDGRIFVGNVQLSSPSSDVTFFTDELRPSLSSRLRSSADDAASLHYSHSLDRLFVGFKTQHSYVLELNSDLDQVTSSHELKDSVTGRPFLSSIQFLHWFDVDPEAYTALASPSNDIDTFSVSGNDKPNNITSQPEQQKRGGMVACLTTSSTANPDRVAFVQLLPNGYPVVRHAEVIDSERGVRAVGIVDGSCVSALANNAADRVPSLFIYQDDGSLHHCYLKNNGKADSGDDSCQTGPGTCVFPSFISYPRHLSISTNDGVSHGIGKDGGRDDSVSGSEKPGSEAGPNVGRMTISSVATARLQVSQRVFENAHKVELISLEGDVVGSQRSIRRLLVSRRPIPSKRSDRFDLKLSLPNEYQQYCIVGLRVEIPDSSRKVPKAVTLKRRSDKSVPAHSEPILQRTFADSKQRWYDLPFSYQTSQVLFDSGNTLLLNFDCGPSGDGTEGDGNSSHDAPPLSRGDRMRQEMMGLASGSSSHPCIAGIEVYVNQKDTLEKEFLARVNRESKSSSCSGASNSPDSSSSSAADGSGESELRIVTFEPPSPLLTWDTDNAKSFAPTPFLERGVFELSSRLWKANWILMPGVDEDIEASRSTVAETTSQLIVSSMPFMSGSPFIDLDYVARYPRCSEGPITSAAGQEAEKELKKIPEASPPRRLCKDDFQASPVARSFLSTFLASDKEKRLTLLQTGPAQEKQTVEKHLLQLLSGRVDTYSDILILSSIHGQLLRILASTDIAGHCTATVAKQLTYWMEGFSAIGRGRPASLRLFISARPAVIGTLLRLAYAVCLGSEVEIKVTDVTRVHPLSSTFVISLHDRMLQWKHLVLRVSSLFSLILTTVDWTSPSLEGTPARACAPPLSVVAQLDGLPASDERLFVVDRGVKSSKMDVDEDDGPIIDSKSIVFEIVRFFDLILTCPLAETTPSSSSSSSSSWPLSKGQEDEKEREQKSPPSEMDVEMEGHSSAPLRVDVDGGMVGKGHSPSSTQPAPVSVDSVFHYILWTRYSIAEMLLHHLLLVFLPKAEKKGKNEAEKRSISAIKKDLKELQLRLDARRVTEAALPPPVRRGGPVRYECDMCGTLPIVGVRYRCAESACIDYDMCSKCYSDFHGSGNRDRERHGHKPSHEVTCYFVEGSDAPAPFEDDDGKEEELLERILVPVGASSPDEVLKMAIAESMPKQTLSSSSTDESRNIQADDSKSVGISNGIRVMWVVTSLLLRSFTRFHERTDHDSASAVALRSGDPRNVPFLSRMPYMSLLVSLIKAEQSFGFSLEHSLSCADEMSRFILQPGVVRLMRAFCTKHRNELTSVADDNGVQKKDEQKKMPEGKRDEMEVETQFSWSSRRGGGGGAREAVSEPESSDIRITGFGIERTSLSTIYRQESETDIASVVLCLIGLRRLLSRTGRLAPAAKVSDISPSNIAELFSNSQTPQASPSSVMADSPSLELGPSPLIDTPIPSPVGADGAPSPTPVPATPESPVGFADDTYIAYQVIRRFLENRELMDYLLGAVWYIFDVKCGGANTSVRHVTSASASEDPSSKLLKEDYSSVLRPLSHPFFSQEQLNDFVDDPNSDPEDLFTRNVLLLCKILAEPFQLEKSKTPDTTPNVTGGDRSGSPDMEEEEPFAPHQTTSPSNVLSAGDLDAMAQLKQRCFSSDWYAPLCGLVYSERLSDAHRKNAKRLLSTLCGSDEKRYEICDRYLCEQESKTMLECLGVDSLSIEEMQKEGASPNQIPYEKQCRVYLALFRMLAVAEKRRQNWVSFCNDQPKVFQKLVLASVADSCGGEFVGPTLVSLLALSSDYNVPVGPMTTTKKRRKSRSKSGKNSSSDPNSSSSTTSGFVDGSDDTKISLVVSDHTESVKLRVSVSTVFHENLFHKFVKKHILGNSRVRQQAVLALFSFYRAPDERATLCSFLSRWIPHLPWYGASSSCLMQMICLCNGGSGVEGNKPEIAASAAGSVSSRAASPTTLAEPTLLRTLSGSSNTSRSSVLSAASGSMFAPPSSTSQPVSEEVKDSASLPELVVVSPEVKEKSSEALMKVVNLFDSVSHMLQSHPNSDIYRCLPASARGDTDSFYLEGPCELCCHGNHKFTTSKLVNISKETKYSVESVAATFFHSQAVNVISIRADNVKSTKMIRGVKLYFSNKTISDLTATSRRIDPEVWTLAKEVVVKPQTKEIRIALAMPVLARHILIQFSSFHDSPNGEMELLSCPQCSASVTSKHGVCHVCHDNAFQCRNCRNINYESLDAFLCNVCGNSRFGSFNVSVVSRKHHVVEPLASEEQMNVLLESLQSMHTNVEKHDASLAEVASLIRDDLETIKAIPSTSHFPTTRSLVSGADPPLSSTSSSSHNAAEESKEVEATRERLLQRYTDDAKQLHKEAGRELPGIIASQLEIKRYLGKSFAPVLPAAPQLFGMLSDRIPDDPFSTSSAGEITLNGGALSVTPRRQHCFRCISRLSLACVSFLGESCMQPYFASLSDKGRRSLVHGLFTTSELHCDERVRDASRSVLCEIAVSDLHLFREVASFVFERLQATVKQPQNQGTSHSIATLVCILNSLCRTPTQTGSVSSTIPNASVPGTVPSSQGTTSTTSRQPALPTGVSSFREWMYERLGLLLDIVFMVVANGGGQHRVIAVGVLLPCVNLMQKMWSVDLFKSPALDKVLTTLKNAVEMNQSQGGEEKDWPLEDTPSLSSRNTPLLSGRSSRLASRSRANSLSSPGRFAGSSLVGRSPLIRRSPHVGGLSARAQRRPGRSPALRSSSALARSPNSSPFHALDDSGGAGLPSLSLGSSIFSGDVNTFPSDLTTILETVEELPLLLCLDVDHFRQGNPRIAIPWMELGSGDNNCISSFSHFYKVHVGLQELSQSPEASNVTLPASSSSIPSSVGAAPTLSWFEEVFANPLSATLRSAGSELFSSVTLSGLLHDVIRFQQRVALEEKKGGESSAELLSEFEKSLQTTMKRNMDFMLSSLDRLRSVFQTKSSGEESVTTEEWRVALVQEHGGDAVHAIHRELCAKQQQYSKLLHFIRDEMDQLTSSDLGNNTRSTLSSSLFRSSSLPSSSPFMQSSSSSSSSSNVMTKKKRGRSIDKSSQSVQPTSEPPKTLKKVKVGGDSSDIGKDGKGEAAAGDGANPTTLDVLEQAVQKGLVDSLCDLVLGHVSFLAQLETCHNDVLFIPGCLDRVSSFLASLIRSSSRSSVQLQLRERCGDVFRAYLQLRGLVQQRSQCSDACATRLVGVVKSVFSDSDDDRKSTLRIHFSTLVDQELSKDTRSAIFILQQICNLVDPPKPEPTCDVILMKKRSQEDFIRGEMTKNPYSSKDFPGELMSDIKNKICQDLGLTDSGIMFELLVNNKIISFDLPIIKVYEKVWKPALLESESAALQEFLETVKSTRLSGVNGENAMEVAELADNVIHNVDESLVHEESELLEERIENNEVPMVVTYRLTGLDGEATEDVVDTIADDQTTIDPEVEFAIASVMAECGGIECLLSKFDELLSSCSLEHDVERKLFGLLVEVLSYSVKLKCNRDHLRLIPGAVSSLVDKLLVGLGNPLLFDISKQLFVVIGSILREDKADLPPASSSSASMDVEDEKERECKEQDVPPPESNKRSLKRLKQDVKEGQDKEQDESDNGEVRKLLQTDVSESKLLSQLASMLSLLERDEIKKDSELVTSLMELIPRLTYGKQNLARALVRYFQPHCDWKSFDETTESNSRRESSYFLGCFAELTDHIPNNEVGECIRDYLFSSSLTRNLMEYLTSTASNIKELMSVSKLQANSSSSSSSSAVDVDLSHGKRKRESGDDDNQATEVSKPAASSTAVEELSGEVKVNVDCPSLPHVLRILKGVCNGHRASQLLALELGVPRMLHKIEGVSSGSKVGPIAESLLSALVANNASVEEVLQKLRQFTRNEKKRLALARRKQMLAEMGFKMDAKKPTNLVAEQKIEGMDALVEEAGSKCVVCHEGLSLKPGKMLGIYVFTKAVAVNLDMLAVSTVSHFHIIHYLCHRQAVRADNRLKPRKSEWEGATIRNSHTLCNNIWPIFGPTISVSDYSVQVDRFWDGIKFKGELELSRFDLLKHDLRMLLGRFAYEESFSSDAKGGGKESNAHFIPFMIQMGINLLSSPHGYPGPTTSSSSGGGGGGTGGSASSSSPSPSFSGIHPRMSISQSRDSLSELLGMPSLLRSDRNSSSEGKDQHGEKGDIPDLKVAMASISSLSVVLSTAYSVSFDNVGSAMLQVELEELEASLVSTLFLFNEAHWRKHRLIFLKELVRHTLGLFIAHHMEESGMGGDDGDDALGTSGKEVSSTGAPASSSSFASTSSSSSSSKSAFGSGRPSSDKMDIEKEEEKDVSSSDPNSSAARRTFVSSNPDLLSFSQYRPALCLWGLVNALHEVFQKPRSYSNVRSSKNTDTGSKDSSSSRPHSSDTTGGKKKMKTNEADNNNGLSADSIAEEIHASILDVLRQRWHVLCDCQTPVMDDVLSVVKTLDQEILSAASFGEFCDVVGILSEVLEDAGSLDAFIQKLIDDVV